MISRGTRESTRMLFDIWREITFVLGAARLGLIVILSGLILIYFKHNHEKKRIPSCGKWIPWLGCAIQFGKQPLEFLGVKRKELGDIFTLFVAGEQMTFLLDPEDFHHFFDTSCCDFQMAVQEPVHKLASISREDFFLHHSRLHDTIKGALAPLKIQKLMISFKHHIRENMGNYIKLHEKQDLMDIVCRTMYMSILSTLFGEDNPVISSQEHFEEFIKHFHVFDESFELGSKMPSFLLPRWKAAKQYILERSRQISCQRQTRQPTTDHLNVMDLLWKCLDGDKVHTNYGMLILFASLANTVPASFWLLTYILTNERVRNKVMTELADKFGDKTGEELAQVVSETDFRELRYLQQCVYETIRLRGEGVIGRKVIKPVQIKGYEVPKGSMLMISPYWSHRNEKYFPQPEEFLPERWENCGLEKQGFVAFGGGRFQCPGRWFGMMSMQTMAAMFLLHYTCAIYSPVPKPSLKHVIGIQHPLTPFTVSCVERSDQSS